MARHSLYGGKDNDVEYYGEDDDEDNEDDGIDEDIESIRRACIIAGANPDEIIPPTDGFGSEGGGGENQCGSAAANTGGGGVGRVASDSDSEDDLEMLRSIRNQFALSLDVCEALEPLAVLPPDGFFDDDDDNEEEALETLRAIRKQFSAYEISGVGGNFMDDLSGKKQQVHASGTASGNETSSEILGRSNTCDSFPDHQQPCHTVLNSEAINTGSDFLDANEKAVAEPLDQPGTHGSSLLQAGGSSLPEFAHALFYAIKKNRSYQRLLQEKLTKIEATIEQNKKLMEKVKIFKDCQAYCKKIAGQALSQKMDYRIQLLSTRKSGPSDSSEGNGKKASPLLFGPPENPRVANYQMAMAKYPLSVDRRCWSAAEIENLGKGLRQQIQDRLLSDAIDRSSEGSTNDADTIVQTIRDLEIPPEMIRQFLPEVNWDLLASRYVKHRSGAECEARWMNWEDPLINRSAWTAEEDKNLLLIIQEKGIKDWLCIAELLGTSRTPFQCLARYQRSLNASILERVWTEEDDDQLRAAVEVYGEKDWQAVASVLKGRTGPQCSNRWKKSLHPKRQRVGRWSSEEDKRLKVAVKFFGAKNWHKIAQYVPGRTPPQCRERWVNSLDPNVNRSPWTEVEDAELRAAVADLGHSWSRIATRLPSRTDNQCWRRWKALYPHQVPLIQEARRLRREAIVGNFVDRESERPALGVGDLVALPMISPLLEPDPESEIVASTKKRKRTVKKKPGIEVLLRRADQGGVGKAKRDVLLSCLDLKKKMCAKLIIQNPKGRQ
ncbi:PREDICTED: uncharacterized protein LOC104821834 isoform X2 [Tarenaya hassleriana]|uniref:uncharacterized protein LOC104821834 isoform X2 n=1 Tax=Tarenaya hassleriana TaxID=28532 RepID=UPI00053C7651|nr:PREDICTED: uncharacterized protein LOC104821834 isoform X2 [Tarenaya hassleriana]